MNNENQQQNIANTVNKIYLVDQSKAGKGYVGKLLLLTTMIIVVMLVCAIVSALLDINLILITIILIVALCGYTIYESVKMGKNLRANSTAWATTTDGRVLNIRVYSNLNLQYLSSRMAGQAADTLLGNGGIAGEFIGTAVGTVNAYNAANNLKEFMSNPNNILELIREYQNIKGGVEIKEIRKTNSLVEKTDAMEIMCNFNYLGNTQIIQNQKIILEKVFTDYEELLNIIRTRNY